MGHPDLQIGARGGEVRLLQQLVSEGLDARPGLARDGIFGPLTQGELRRFQQKRGLEADGVAGALTWAALLPSTRASPAAAAPVPRPAQGAAGAAPRPAASPPAASPPAGHQQAKPSAAAPPSPPSRADVINPAAEPPWFQVALAEYQLHHTTRGVADGDQRIHEYFQYTSYRPPVGTHEAWCSAFVNWCMHQVGIQGTNNAGAASWRTWGTALKEPRHGCVMVVHWRKHAKGDTGNHVTFFDRKDGGGIYDFGGNQGRLHAITHSFFPPSAVTSIDYRWSK